MFSGNPHKQMVRDMGVLFLLYLTLLATVCGWNGVSRVPFAGLSRGSARGRFGNRLVGFTHKPTVARTPHVREGGVSSGVLSTSTALHSQNNDGSNRLMMAMSAPVLAQSSTTPTATLTQRVLPTIAGAAAGSGLAYGLVGAFAPPEYRQFSPIVGGLAGGLVGFAYKRLTNVAPQSTIINERTETTQLDQYAHVLPQSVYDFEDFWEHNYTDLEYVHSSVRQAVELTRLDTQDGNLLQLDLRRLEEIASECRVADELLPVYVAIVFADVCVYACQPTLDSSEVPRMMKAVEFAKRCKLSEGEIADGLTLAGLLVGQKMMRSSSVPGRNKSFSSDTPEVVYDPNMVLQAGNIYFLASKLMRSTSDGYYGKRFTHMMSYLPPQELQAVAQYMCKRHVSVFAMGVLKDPNYFLGPKDMHTLRKFLTFTPSSTSATASASFSNVVDDIEEEDIDEMMWHHFKQYLDQQVSANVIANNGFTDAYDQFVSGSMSTSSTPGALDIASLKKSMKILLNKVSKPATSSSSVVHTNKQPQQQSHNNNLFNEYTFSETIQAAITPAFNQTITSLINDIICDPTTASTVDTVTHKLRFALRYFPISHTRARAFVTQAIANENRKYIQQITSIYRASNQSVVAAYRCMHAYSVAWSALQTVVHAVFPSTNTPPEHDHDDTGDDDGVTSIYDPYATVSENEIANMDTHLELRDTHSPSHTHEQARDPNNEMIFMDDFWRKFSRGVNTHTADMSIPGLPFTTMQRASMYKLKILANTYANSTHQQQQQQLAVDEDELFRLSEEERSFVRMQLQAPHIFQWIHDCIHDLKRSNTNINNHTLPSAQTLNRELETLIASSGLSRDQWKGTFTNIYHTETRKIADTHTIPTEPDMATLKAIATFLGCSQQTVEMVHIDIFGDTFIRQVHDALETGIQFVNTHPRTPYNNGDIVGSPLMRLANILALSHTHTQYLFVLALKEKYDPLVRSIGMLYHSVVNGTELPADVQLLTLEDETNNSQNITANTQPQQPQGNNSTQTPRADRRQPRKAGGTVADMQAFMDECTKFTQLFYHMTIPFTGRQYNTDADQPHTKSPANTLPASNNHPANTVPTQPSASAIDSEEEQDDRFRVLKTKDILNSLKLLPHEDIIGIYKHYVIGYLSDPDARTRDYYYSLLYQFGELLGLPRPLQDKLKMSVLVTCYQNLLHNYLVEQVYAHTQPKQQTDSSNNITVTAIPDALAPIDIDTHSESFQQEMMEALQPFEEIKVALDVSEEDATRLFVSSAGKVVIDLLSEIMKEKEEIVEEEANSNSKKGKSDGEGIKGKTFGERMKEQKARSKFVIGPVFASHFRYLVRSKRGSSLLVCVDWRLDCNLRGVNDHITLNLLCCRCND
jgi:hypothetical protein